MIFDDELLKFGIFELVALVKRMYRNWSQKSDESNHAENYHVAIVQIRFYQNLG